MGRWGWRRLDEGGNQLGSCSGPIGGRDKVLAVVLGGKEEPNTRNRREVLSMGLGGSGLKGEENSRKCPYFWLLGLLG